jgi:hypothetical protein
VIVHEPFHEIVAIAMCAKGLHLKPSGSCSTDAGIMVIRIDAKADAK